MIPCDDESMVFVLLVLWTLGYEACDLLRGGARGMVAVMMTCDGDIAFCICGLFWAFGYEACDCI